MDEIIREYKVKRDMIDKLRREGYAEIPYIDHYSDGAIKGGTEDFTEQRWFSQTARRSIYRKTSQMNRGGHSIWEEIECLTCRTATDCGKLARAKYPEETLSVRKF